MKFTPFLYGALMQINNSFTFNPANTYIHFINIHTVQAAMINSKCAVYAYMPDGSEIWLFMN